MRSRPPPRRRRQRRTQGDGGDAFAQAFAHLDAAVAGEAAGEEAAGEAAGEDAGGDAGGDAGDDAGDDAEALPHFTAEAAAEQQQPHQPQANDELTEQAQQLETQQQQPPEQAQPQQPHQHEAQLVAQQQELTMEQQQQDNMMNWLTEEGLFDAVVQMTQDANDDNNNNGDITIDAIRDGVVANDTLRQYMSEIINNRTMRGCVPTTQGCGNKSNRFYEQLTQILFSLWRQSLLWDTCPMSCRVDTKDMVGISRNLHLVVFVLHCFTCFVCIIVPVSLTHFVWSLATCSKVFTEA